MPKKMKTTRRVRRTSAPPESTLVPRVSFNRAERALATVVRRISYTTTLATASYITIDSSAMASSSEWSSLTTSYASVRCLALRLHVSPSASAADAGFLLFCTHRNGNVPASTISALWAGERPLVFDAGATARRLVFYQARPTGAGDTLFVATGSLPNTFGIKFYNGASGTVNIFVEFVAEFRTAL